MPGGIALRESAEACEQGVFRVGFGVDKEVWCDASGGSAADRSVDLCDQQTAKKDVKNISHKNQERPSNLSKAERLDHCFEGDKYGP